MMNFSLFRSSPKSADIGEIEAFAESMKSKIEEEGPFVQKSKQSVRSPFQAMVAAASSETGSDFRASIKRPTVADYRAFAEDPHNHNKIVIKTQGNSIEGALPLSLDENGVRVMRTEKGVCFLDKEKKTIAADFVAALQEQQENKEVTFHYSQKEIDAISETGLSQKTILKILGTEKEISEDLGNGTWRDVDGESDATTSINGDSTDSDTDGESRSALSQQDHDSITGTPLSSPALSRKGSFSSDTGTDKSDF